MIIYLIYNYVITTGTGNIYLLSSYTAGIKSD